MVGQPALSKDPVTSGFLCIPDSINTRSSYSDNVIASVRICCQQGYYGLFGSISQKSSARAHINREIFARVQLFIFSLKFFAIKGFSLFGDSLWGLCHTHTAPLRAKTNDFCDVDIMPVSE